MAENRFTNRIQLGLGEASLFLVVSDWTIKILDSYSRWEAAVSLHHYLTFLDSPMAVPILLVVGLFLIHHAQTSQLAQSISRAQDIRLHDATGARIAPAIKIPSLRGPSLVVGFAILVAVVYLLALIMSYNPVPPSLVAKVVVPIEKTRPWTLPTRPVPRVNIEQKTYGPNSPNVVGHDNNFNYSVEPPTRILRPEQLQLFDLDMSALAPVPFSMVIETAIHTHPDLETTDEPGIFGKQLEDVLASNKWEDLLHECNHAKPGEACKGGH